MSGQDHEALSCVTPVAAAKIAIAALKITPTTNTSQPGTMPTAARSMKTLKSRAGNGCK